MSKHDRPLLAVLIDADNVPAKYAAKILREIASIGEPALRRVYGDWSDEHLKSWREPIHSLGLVAHQETANSKGKNASDIGLVIHAMDILHSGKFDGFVIVSSDSDFTALVNRLREDGLMVVGIGEQKTLPALRNVYNRFILVENLLDDEDETTAKKKSNVDLNHAFQLVRNALERCETDGNDWATLALVGTNLAAAHPDFDARSYGYSKLSGLIRALKQLEFSNKENRAMVRVRKKA